MPKRKSRAGRVPPRRLKQSRKPKWILGGKDLDLIAQRRCLMILSVLSGEKSVEEASREAQIAPAMYYLIEKKALMAMLAALVPGAMKDGSPTPALAQMEKRITELETTKRRLERLLFLTKMTLRPGPVTQGKRGRPRTVHASVGAGRKRSRRSKKETASKTDLAPPSTPTPDGAGEP
jgi:hypothetical protein